MKTEQEDTNKVKTLNILSEKFWRKSIYDTSLIFANNAKVLAENISFKKGIAVALRNIAIVYWYQGKYQEALDCQQKALIINREIGNESGIAANLGNIGSIYKDEGDYVKALDYYMQGMKIDAESGDKSRINGDLGNIGIIYHIQGDYPKSLDYYLQALKIDEEIGDKGDMGRHLSNIGNVYVDESEYAKALDYYKQALKIDEEIGAKSDMSYCLMNIGNVYSSREDYPQSLDYYTQALKLAEELGDIQLQAACFGNIGNIYSSQGNYSKALNYCQQALKMDEEIGNKNGLAGDLGNIGMLYTKTGKFKQSEIYLKRAIALDDSMGVLSDLGKYEEGLSQLYDTTKQYKIALEYYKKAIAINDTLFNKDKSNALTRKEVSYQFEKKEAAEKAEQDKKDALAAAEARKEKIIIWSVATGLLLVLVFALFVFRSLRITRKQKRVIERKNIVIEEKNKDILDSITYAKRLQDAILPPLSLIKQYLPDSFVLYKPKDIVAGDFYWIAPLPPEGGSSVNTKNPPLECNSEAVLIAAADCTGHGVPGAMVSVVCSNALNRTVKEFKITEPGKILDKVRELVLETFEKSENNVQDGMDISLAAISHKPLANSMEVQWSGAFNSLWYVQNGELKELSGDKQPIGKTDNPKPFTTHTITLNPPSEGREAGLLYLFTDGYADQFGGDKGKKFKYKQLQQLIMDNYKLTMQEQKQILEQALEDWKGNLEQVDDILIIGIRI
ncbi:MAG: tetratricopeptide repeat protein [Bacteroidia bacterium]